MVDPKIQCKQHLLGEHNEIHLLTGSLRKKRSIHGYVVNNCVELSSMKKRHDELVEEMVRRGYNHESPLVVPDYDYLPSCDRDYLIDRTKNLILLVTRCEMCGGRLE